MTLDGFTQRFNLIWQDVHDQLGTVGTRPQARKTKPVKPNRMTATNVTKQAKAFEIPIALMCYCVSSISMTLMNKYVLSSHKFKMNFLLLALQSFVSVVFLRMCKTSKLVSFRELNPKDAKAWLPVSLMLVAMIYTGSLGLQYLPVSLFTVFKNLTIIGVALGERHLFQSKITPLMWISFGLIVSSSLLGAYHDISFNFAGYFWMLTNCLVSAGYILYMRRAIKAVGFADLDSVYYNNCLGVPVMIVLSLFVDNWRDFVAQYFGNGPLVDNRASLFIGMLISSISAFMISYSTAWSVRVASSTTYSMCGALNKLPIAISGFLFLSSERAMFNFGNLASVLLAFGSGIIYSMAQIRLRAEKAKYSPPLTAVSEVAAPTEDPKASMLAK